MPRASAISWRLRRFIWKADAACSIRARDDEAIAELRRTIFLAPYESEAHLLLGRIYLRTGRPQDAIDALTIAAWSDPDSAEAKELLESVARSDNCRLC